MISKKRKRKFKSIPSRSLDIILSIFNGSAMFLIFPVNFQLIQDAITKQLG